MEELQALLLDVWREAGRHTEIAQSTINIAQLLARCMPVELVLVRRIEAEHACIETVGVGPECTLPRSLSDRSACAPAHLRRLLAWCKRGEVMLRRRDAKLVPDVAAAVPPGLDGELLLGSLLSEPGTYGVVLLLAAPSECFTPLHQQMLQALLEPLATALAND